MQADTETLVTRAEKGDQEAIGALLERHLPALRAYIRLRMGPRIRRWDSESDLAQSVCRSTLESLDGFVYRGEAAFRQWLFTMARRKLSRRDAYLTAERRDVDLLETNALVSGDGGERMAREIHAAFGTPSQLAVRRETLERIERVLDSMPEEAREVILLSRLAGLSNAEIARKLGKKESTVRTMLCRALATLSTALL